MSLDKPTGAEKRKAYLLWFFVAFGIDAAWSLSGDGSYRPSLIGLAIMIAAVLFFAHSWFTDR